MKILRIKRGYTTNSSGGNEWVPPKTEAGLPMQSVPDASPSATLGILDPSSQQTTQPATISQPSSKVPAVAPKPSAGQSSKTATGYEPWAGFARDPREQKRDTNLGIMVTLVVVVCLLFILGGVIRAKRKRK